MIRLGIFFITFMVIVEARDLVIIGDKSFEDKNITLQEVKDIFLAKKRYLKGKKILVMNYEYNHTLRHCFEKKLLKKSSRSLEQYWREAYYRGKRPPKIIKSKEMLLSYMKEIQPSLGYLYKDEKLPEYTFILFEIECQE